MIDINFLRDRRHPIYNSKIQCKALLESVPQDRRIRGDDERMSSDEAREMGCHEIAHSSTNKSIRRPRNSRENKRVYYYQAACAIAHGNREIVVSRSAMDQLTASHICGNDHCINPDHIDWETFRENLKRRGCYGYVLDRATGEKHECEGCEKRHSGRRCLTVLSVKGVPKF